MSIGNPSRRQGTIYGLYCVCGCTARIKYVGQTIQDPRKRFNAHLQVARQKKRKDAFTRKSEWIREHGPDNIRFIVLEENPEDGLDSAEVRWINKEGTLYPAGTNMATGGYEGSGLPGEKNPAVKLTEDQVREIIEKLPAPGQTSYSLAAEYGVTKTLILKIDHGDLWTELPRPHGTRLLSRNSRVTITSKDAEEIRAMYATGQTRAAIARELGLPWSTVGNVVSGKTWAK